MTTSQIKNNFNRTSENLGCKARLGGNKRNPEFQMWTGSVSASGHEIVIKIDCNEFVKLTSKYPELQNHY